MVNVATFQISLPSTARMTLNQQSSAQKNTLHLRFANNIARDRTIRQIPLP